MPAQIKSPASASSPGSDVSNVKDALKHRPPPIPKRSTFDLEPNPFEQSFARPSNDSSVRTHQNSPTAASDANDARSHSRTSSVDNADRSHSPPDAHKTVLPPLAAIASPSDAHYSWAFSSSSFSNSLRSGPLSPAMLTGPQQQPDQPLAAFDPAAFRTGLTPRMGLTPGTGLTPLLGGPFPPASPNTAAFLSSVMNNNGPPSLSGVAGTITPNTLSAITGVLATQQHHAAGHVQSPLSMSAVTAGGGYSSRNDSSAATNGSSANGNSNGYSSQQTAPNGLFLLSQAHQELTKREEEQAAAAAAQMNGSPTTSNGPANGHANGKRGTKRKSYDTESPVSASATVSQPPQQHSQQNGAGHKRTRSQTMSSNGRRGSTISVEMGEEEEDDDDDEDGMLGGGASSTSSGHDGQQQSNGTAKKNGSGHKKPETEEEKRRNFLERNRQAALKCRQRKKAWLAQLQAKVEFLQNENETLKQALVSSREEITRLSSIVGTSGTNGSGVSANGVPPMQTGHGLSGVGLAPTSKNMPAMVGGGGRYGY